MLEPADSREAKEFVRIGLEISEQFRTPVLVRTSTRISHSRGLVELGERIPSSREVKFEKDPPRFVAIPMWARQMRVAVEKRQNELRAYAESSELNRIEWGSRDLGIVTHSVTYQYVKEAFPEASVLKLGMSFPFPDAKIREFAAGVKRVLVIEDLDDILEEHIKAMGIACDGRNIVPGIGELTPVQLATIRERVNGQPAQPAATAPAFAANLPARPPVLCPGCPHRGVFYALAQHDVVVTGDIGCYSLGVMKPLARLDTILCMGAGVSMAHGMEKAGEKRKVVGMVGDSTFFHSGITGLLDIVFNRGASTIFVVDNRTTAMTGHQDNPGSGRTLMGEPTHATSIEAIARACGVQRVRTIDPYDLIATMKAVEEELNSDEPSVVVSVAPCVLQERKMIGPRRAIDAPTCKACGLCLRLGCPAVEGGGKGVKPVMNELLCNGCGMCQQVCRFGAVKSVEVSA
jgi:indolepyruvate ferredoxin oxidoreductase alpha subunit